MYCIGLTGNIASGKTTVASYFHELGIEIINADAITKTLTQKGQVSFEKIVDYFGKEVLTQHGELNRKYLRDKIFNNYDKRVWLEQLLHPLIREEIKQQLSKITSPYCVIEIPLLTDKADYPYINRVIQVETTPVLQIERCSRRDSHSKEYVLTIISVQNSKKRHPSLVDDIIVNNQSLDDLKLAVKRLHEHYLELSQSQFNPKL